MSDESKLMKEVDENPGIFLLSSQTKTFPIQVIALDLKFTSTSLKIKNTKLLQSTGFINFWIKSFLSYSLLSKSIYSKTQRASSGSL